jgi:hypothetical protein
MQAAFHGQRFPSGHSFAFLQLHFLSGTVLAVVPEVFVAFVVLERIRWLCLETALFTFSMQE